MSQIFSLYIEFKKALVLLFSCSWHQEQFLELLKCLEFCTDIFYWLPFKGLITYVDYFSVVISISIWIFVAFMIVPIEFEIFLAICEIESMVVNLSNISPISVHVLFLIHFPTSCIEVDQMNTCWDSIMLTAKIWSKVIYTAFCQYKSKFF